MESETKGWGPTFVLAPNALLDPMLAKINCTDRAMHETYLNFRPDYSPEISAKNNMPYNILLLGQASIFFKTTVGFFRGAGRFCANFCPFNYPGLSDDSPGTGRKHEKTGCTLLLMRERPGSSKQFFAEMGGNR
jgi:hypothetical protein